jgi:hypothetical protein
MVQESLDFKPFVKEYNEYLLLSLKTKDPTEIVAQRTRLIHIGNELRENISREKKKFAYLLENTHKLSQKMMLQNLRSWFVEQEYEFEGKMKQLSKDQEEYNDFMCKMTS